MSKSKSIVILGIDGMDPDVFRLLHNRGEMPVLGAMAKAGNFRTLATSNPPQSPVSWTTIATGSNPGKHGIFDFLHRNPKTYTPELSLFGIEQYKGGVRYTSNVRLPTIFERAMKRGISVILLRWPLTFPAPGSLPSNSQLLSGTGVPDLLGTLGRYTFYTADSKVLEQDKHGRIVHIKPKKGVVNTEVYGPRYLGWKGLKEATVSMTLELTLEGLKVTLPDTTLQLNKEIWSPHVIIRFSIGLLGKVSAVTRMVCIESEPFPSLFMLPMQIYPKDTTLPLSSPRTFGKDIWDKIGPYLTLGMPEDTNGLKDGLIPDSVFLSLCNDVFAERERMLDSTLDNFDKGIFVCVFDTLDRIQHMFWKDRTNSLQKSEFNEPTNVVIEWYRRMDAMVGRVIQRIGDGIPLLILSDHGFTSLDTYVHLNSWLTQNGFMVLKNGKKEGGLLFEDVDWSKTRAYALGFNSIYINIKGREGKGIIEPDEVNTLCVDLMQKLAEWSENGNSIVKKVYKGGEIFSIDQIDNGPDLVVGYQKGYRASKQTVLGEAPAGRLIEDNYEHWCGDHCCDPSFVPGVLFGANLHKANLNLPDMVSVEDISSIIEKWVDTD